MQIRSLTTVEIGELSANQISALSAPQLADLSLTQVAGLTAAQVGALTNSQLSGLTAANFQALNGFGFTLDQITGLSASAVSNLTNAQFDALATNNMLGAIGPGLKGITTGELSSLTAAGLAQFSTAQIAGMTAVAQTDIKTIFAAQTGTKNILAVANANGASYSPLIEEIQLLRNADPGVVLPGVDTPTGNMLAASALKPLSSLPTSGSGIIYDATDNIVRINGSNLTLSGYDLGSATVYVNGSNDTIEDCNFTATSGWYGVQVLSGDNTTVTNNTFNGEGIPAKLAAWITSKGSVTITGNTFIDTPSDGIDLFRLRRHFWEFFPRSGVYIKWNPSGRNMDQRQFRADLNYRQLYRLGYEPKFKLLRQRLHPHHQRTRQRQQRDGNRQFPVRRRNQHPGDQPGGRQRRGRPPA